MRSHRVSGYSVVLLGLVFVLLVGCTSTAVDKSGAEERLTLTVGYSDGAQNSNGQSYAGPAFITALKEKLGERLDLVVKGGLGQSRAGGEAATLRAIAAGEVDAGWLPSRAFSDAGFDGFDALSAPMVITSYEAEDKVVKGDTAAAFLEQLDGTELVGLSLAVGSLRHPVGIEPVLDTGDWKRAAFGILDQSQADEVAVTGATPVTVKTSVQSAFTDDSINSTDLDVASYNSAELSRIAPFVTSNVVLWPKVWVFVMNRARFDALTGADRQSIQEAADAATEASVAGSHFEETLVNDTCAAGARFPFATPGQVEDLRSAFRPAINALLDDPVDGPLLERLQTIAQKSPGVAVLPASLRCQGEVEEQEPVGAIPDGPSSIPVGTYRTTLSLQNLLDAGVEYGRAVNNDVVVTLVVGPDGSYRIIGDDIAPSPDGVYSNLLWEVGQLTGRDHRAYFVPDVKEFRRLKESGVNSAIDEPGAQVTMEPYSAEVTFENGLLTFVDVVGITDPIGELWFTANPYEKID